MSEVQYRNYFATLRKFEANTAYQNFRSKWKDQVPTRGTRRYAEYLSDARTALEGLKSVEGIGSLSPAR
jgi:hypothetical protein